MLTAAAVVVPTTSAALITGANDRPTTLQSGQAANHTVLFTTPTGVSEGSTMTLSFSASFDTSSIIQDDVDVADDGTDLTTASTCTGTQQASVAIASDIVTITICAGDGGSIAAGSQVSIEIGTNATASGTGANRITNPSSTGTYFVTVAGTMGDDGSIALPISGDDSVAVSGVIPTSSSEFGTGGDLTDTTAPTISNIVVSGVTSSSATVAWSTNEAASSAVDYGLTTSFESGTVSSSALATAHSVSLAGLGAGQTYYFRVRSSDSASNQATSSTQTFSTTDSTAPIISSVSVVDVTTSSARLTWTTDEAATSVVSYGLTSSYGQSRLNSSLVTSHSILLTGLAQATTYHFQVLSADASSNQSFSSDQTFTTDEDVAPTNVSGLSVTSGNGNLSLSWSNPSDADLAGVRVLACTNTFPDSPTDADCSVLTNALAMSFAHTGLVNGLIYYYGIFAYDAAGQFASGALGSGTPSAPVEEPLCGDMVCSFTESTTSCPSDCVPAEEALCGDNICSSTESALSCPGDCGAPEEPIVLEDEGSTLSDVDLVYLVGGGSIALTTTVSGVIEVLPARALRVQVPVSQVGVDVEEVLLFMGSDTYLMRLNEVRVRFETDVETSSTSGIFDLRVNVTHTNGSQQTASSYLRVVAPGYVYQVVDGEEAVVPQASITLLERVGREWVVWDGSPYGQFNPTRTLLDGTFAWYVPDATYYVSVESPEFKSTQSSVLLVDNSIVNPRVLLVPIKKEEEEEEEVMIEEVSAPESTSNAPSSAPQTYAEIFTAGVAKPIAAVQETLQTVREIPGVETAAEVSTPALALTAGASVVVMAVAFDLLPFLQYFFTAPVLFFWRRKRKSFGVIYNAISKTPVDLATVRLYQISDEDEAAGRPGRLIKSRVTDRGGRYYFLVTPGRYRIAVTKTGFQFPTEYLKGETTDGQYLDVYHGEPVMAHGSGVVITANIPMDPSQAEKFRAPAAVIFRKRLRLLQHMVAVAGVLVALAVTIIRPNVFSIGMVGIQMLMYLLAKRLATPHRPINWGIVYDKKTGRPIAQTIARIFEPKYNKVLETQVTDSKGRYAFLLGPNEYFAMFEKKGYMSREIRPIDYSKNQEPKDFSQKVALEPVPLSPRS